MQVKEYRLRKGYTQKQIATFLGINEKAYSHKERGIRGFDVEELL
ncbi:MAG: helix-turn-helix transcriptional regulator, partial [Paraclostridium sp.]